MARPLNPPFSLSGRIAIAAVVAGIPGIPGILVISAAVNLVNGEGSAVRPVGALGLIERSPVAGCIERSMSGIPAIPCISSTTFCGISGAPVISSITSVVGSNSGSVRFGKLFTP